MERSETARNKRSISDAVQDTQDVSLQTQSSKRISPSFLNGFEAQSEVLAEILSAKQVAILESCIRSLVHEVVEIELNSYTRSILSRNSQLSNEIGKEAIFRCGKLKFKLFFFNQTAATIFTDNEIEAENGKALVVAICDTTNSNAIIKTGPLSSALVEFVVLDGEFGSGQRREETSWSASDFNKNIVSRREGKRPLIVGNGMLLYLKNGVGHIQGSSFSDNSSWTRSKKFRLGAKVVDEKILAKFPRIGEAVSQPVRVMDHRGEVYKKHHPPSREDDIWRLEGIGRNGVYHNRLWCNDIKTVDDFLKAYQEKGPTYLRKLLGERVPQITWKKMVSHALECDDAPTVSSASDPSFRVNVVVNEAMGNRAPFDENLEVGEQSSVNDGHGFSAPEFGGQLQDLVSYPPSVEQHLAEIYQAFEGIGELQDYNCTFDDDYPPLLSHGEASTSYNHNHKVGNASTRNHYFEGRPWAGLVPKPK